MTQKQPEPNNFGADLSLTAALRENASYTVLHFRNFFIRHEIMTAEFQINSKNYQIHKKFVDSTLRDTKLLKTIFKKKVYEAIKFKNI